MPSNGNNHGACPGYVIEHIQALDCGGVDDQSNMQWQSIAEGKEKDARLTEVAVALTASVVSLRYISRDQEVDVLPIQLVARKGMFNNTLNVSVNTQTIRIIFCCFLESDLKLYQELLSGV
jgi:hypothetical protein